MATNKRDVELALRVTTNGGEAVGKLAGDLHGLANEGEQMGSAVGRGAWPAAFGYRILQTRRWAVHRIDFPSQAKPSQKGTPVSEQISFETNDFASNPEPRCPCVLLLDVSGSMDGKPINELNAGLAVFREELAGDSLAMKRVEVAIVTFGPVKTEVPFTGASTFYPPTLQSQGDTPMGAAILQALNLVRDRKSDYKASGISYYRPWIFLITDGGPTDSWQAAADAIREGEAGKKFAFFAIGVQGARMDILEQISVRKPLSLNGLKFREMFTWLSSSLSSVSQSTPGTEVPLQAPQGWASV